MTLGLDSLDAVEVVMAVEEVRFLYHISSVLYLIAHGLPGIFDRDTRC